MHLKRTARRLMPWACVLSLGMLVTVDSRGQPPEPKIPTPSVVIDRTGALIVPLGGLVAFEPGDALVGPPTDILVSNDAVLGVRLDPNNPKRFLLTGRTAGLSQLTILQKDRPPLRYDVVVQPDLALLRALIKRTVPTANVDVQPGIGNVIVLSGYVTSPQDADIISRLSNAAVGGSAANVVNAIQIGGVQQVQIDVVIASVDRNALRARGFDFAIPGRGSVSFSSIVSGLLGVQTATGGVPTFSPTANLQLAVLPNRFFGALQALRTEGVAKFLAEPRVVTQTGRTAFFRAGGQQAILSATSGITGPGVQLVPFGTELEVVPIVYGNGMIWLDINPRITAVSQGLGITVNGANSPGFTEQVVRSTVMLESGQTFAIGGLIQNSVQATAQKVPFIGDLPYIGTGFSQVNYQTRESELIILVTPRLVHPLDQCQAPKRLPGQETRTPDDYELFLENILEAPRGQRKVWNGKCYNAAYKCDPTVNRYPCAGNVCTGPNGTCLPAPGPGPIPGLLSAPGTGIPGAAAQPGTVPPAVMPPAGSLPPMPPPIPSSPGGAGAVAPPEPMPTSAPGALPAIPGAPGGDGNDPAPLPPMPPARIPRPQ